MVAFGKPHACQEAFLLNEPILEFWPFRLARRCPPSYCSCCPCHTQRALTVVQRKSPLPHVWSQTWLESYRFVEVAARVFDFAAPKSLHPLQKKQEKAKSDIRYQASSPGGSATGFWSPNHSRARRKSETRLYAAKSGRVLCGLRGPHAHPSLLTKKKRCVESALYLYSYSPSQRRPCNRRLRSSRTLPVSP